MLHYPAILFAPDENGVSGCIVPDMAINAAGRSPDEAIRDAAGIIDELLEDMHRDGEAFPDPTPIDELDLRGGTLVFMSVPLPSRRAAAAA